MNCITKLQTRSNLVIMNYDYRPYRGDRIRLKISNKIIISCIAILLIFLSIVIFIRITKNASMTSTILDQQVPMSDAEEACGVLFENTEPSELQLTEVRVEALKLSYSCLETISEEPPDRDRYDVPLPNDLQDLSKEVAEYYGFDEKLIYQIMSVESEFQCDAINKNGTCYGIMQSNKKYFDNYLNWDDGFEEYIRYNEDGSFMWDDAGSNMIVSVRQLSKWLEISDNNLKVALARYNKGYYYSNLSYANSVLNTEIKQVYKGES